MRYSTPLLAPIRACETLITPPVLATRTAAAHLPQQQPPFLRPNFALRQHFATGTPISSSPYTQPRTNMSQQAEQQALDTRPVIISGPSGTGKSTILKRLFAEYPGRFGFSVSHTTRAPRPGEQDGREYHFTTRDEFEAMVGEAKFVENATFGGNRYGTSFAAVADVARAGRVCVLDIELEGVKQVDRLDKEGKLPFPRPKFLFLAPPSVEVLEQRLRGRGTDADDAVQKRLDQARVEMEFAKTGAIHEKVVVNDELDKAYREVRDFIVGPGAEQ